MITIILPYSADLDLQGCLFVAVSLAWWSWSTRVLTVRFPGASLGGSCCCRRNYFHTAPTRTSHSLRSTHSEGGVAYSNHGLVRAGGLLHPHLIGWTFGWCCSGRAIDHSVMSIFNVHKSSASTLLAQMVIKWAFALRDEPIMHSEGIL